MNDFIQAERQPLEWLVLTLIILVFTLITAHQFYNYTSDDTAQQVIVASLHGHVDIHLPQDTFVLRLPMYWLLAHTGLAPRTSLLLSALLLNGAAITCTFWALRYFLRVAKASPNGAYLSLVWLSSLGGTFVTFVINSNTRNIELGLTLALLALAHKYYVARFSSHDFKLLLWDAGGALAFGLFLYNDPFFVYALVAPLLLFLGARLLLVEFDQRAAELGAWLLVAVIAMMGWSHGLAALGLRHSSMGSYFASLDQMGNNVALLIHALPGLVSGDIFGQPVWRLATLSRAINLGLVVGALLAPIWLIKAFADRRVVWSNFILLHPWYLLGLFIMSGVVVDSQSIRYLTLLPYEVALIWGVFIIPTLSSRAQKSALILIGLGALLNLGFTADNFRHRGDNPNATNYQLIRVIQAQGLTTGYAPYWDAAINTYLSNQTVIFHPVGCSAKIGLQPNNWLTNTSSSKEHAGRSFYVLDPANTQCTQDELTAVYGQPAAALSVPDSAIVVDVYGFDLARNFSR